jgi:putative redox protein
MQMENQDFKATVHHAENEFYIGVSPSKHAVTIDTNHERNAAPTPVELLMIAVGACTAVDVVSILKKKRQDVTDYKVEVSGARRDEHPRSFIELNVHHIVRGRGISAEAVARAIELSDEKYCSVAATVKPTAQITTSFEIVEETRI